MIRTLSMGNIPYSGSDTTRPASTSAYRRKPTSSITKVLLNKNSNPITVPLANYSDEEIRNSGRLTKSKWEQNPYPFKSQRLEDELTQNIRDTYYGAKEKSRLDALKKQKKDETALDKTGDLISKYNPVSLASAGLVKLAINKISKNINPYGYESIFGGTYGKTEVQKKSATSRAMSSLFKKEKSREDVEKFASEGGENSAEPRLRLDLLNMYSNQPQKFNNFTQSKYTPTQGALPNDKYFDSPALKNEIYNDVKARMGDLSFTNKNDLRIKLLKNMVGIAGESGNNLSTALPALGRGTLGIGEDARGVYISYSDKWDINPSEGESADAKLQNSPLKNTLAFAMKKAEQLGVVTPPKVYGRIYLDKKTGLPIKD